MHRVEPVAAGDVEMGVHRREGALGPAPAELGVERHARAFGHGTPLVLARQQPARQSRVGQQRDALVMRRLGHVGVVEPAEQRVLVLHRGDARPARPPGRRVPGGGAPGGLVRQPEMEDVAGLHEPRERARRVVHVPAHGGRILPRRVVGPVLAEVVGAALGPVELVEVDAVGPQAPQRAMDRLGQRLGRDAAPVAQRPAGTDDLGGDEPLVAPPGAREPLAHDRLGASRGLGAHGVHRIHLGRVHERAARLGRTLDLGVGLLRGVLGPPGHGAEAQLADLGAVAAEGDRLHAVSSWMRGARG